ncbi:MAG: hypothetical protein CMJ32_08375 [Phycisphaerae bacterium]|nr:hypothetical protein [Phycisphaerae bacterium]
MTLLQCGILVLLLILSTILSAMFTALSSLSQGSLSRYLEQIGVPGRMEWLHPRMHRVIEAVSLWRIICSTLVILVLVFPVLLDARGVSLVLELIGMSVLAIVLLWVFPSVIGSSISRHAGVELVGRLLPVIHLLDVITAPLTSFIGFVDEAVRRLTGANLKKLEMEQELLRSIEETERQGGLDPVAADMLENGVEFTNTDVSSVMTPRTDMEGIEYTDDLASIRSFIDKAGHSRIPVYEDNLDSIAGILYVKDLISYLGTDASDFRLTRVLRKPIRVPETKNVRDLLVDFQTSEVHMAIVVDEYGGTAGLITIEDVLEEIVGEIHDEHEPEHEDEPTLTDVSEDRFEVDGRFAICDLNEQIGLDIPEDHDFDTIAGFVLDHFGRIPSEGESFQEHGALFTTLKATATQVSRISIERSNGIQESGMPESD